MNTRVEMMIIKGALCNFGTGKAVTYILYKYEQLIKTVYVATMNNTQQNRNTMLFEYYAHFNTLTTSFFLLLILHKIP